MQSQTFKWWYAIVGFLAYNIAILINMLFISATQPLLSGFNFNSGALYNGTLFLFAAVICLLLFRLISKGKISQADFGFHLKKFSKILLFGVAFGLLFLGLSEFAEATNKGLKAAGEDVMNSFNIGENFTNDLLMILGVGLLAPIAEEIVFRGGVFNPLLQGLKKFTKLPSWLPLTIALAVSAFLFVSTHGGGGQDAQLWLLGVLAILAALAMYFTKSLLAAILTHAVNNNLVFMYSLSKLSLDTAYTIKLMSASVICLLLCIPIGLIFGKILPKK